MMEVVGGTTIGHTHPRTITMEARPDSMSLSHETTDTAPNPTHSRTGETERGRGGGRGTGTDGDTTTETDGNYTHKKDFKNIMF